MQRSRISVVLAGLAVVSITTVSACATDKGASSTWSSDCTQAALAEPATGAAEAGTNPVTTTPPADAAIPAKLFLSGCAAG